MTGGGFFQLAQDDGDVFASSRINDVIINTITDSEKIILGTFMNPDGTLYVSASNIKVDGYIDVRDDLISGKGYLNIQGLTVSNADLYANYINCANITVINTIDTDLITAITACNDFAVIEKGYSQDHEHNIMSASNGTLIEGSVWTLTSSNATLEEANCFKVNSSNIEVPEYLSAPGKTELNQMTASNTTSYLFAASNSTVIHGSNTNLDVSETLIGSNCYLISLSNSNFASSNITFLSSTGTSNITTIITTSNISASNIGAVQGTINTLSNTIAHYSIYSFIETLSNTNAFHTSNTVVEFAASNVTIDSNLTIKPNGIAYIPLLFTESNTYSNLRGSNLTASNATFRLSTHTTLNASNINASNLTVGTQLTGSNASLSNLTVASNLVTLNLFSQNLFSSNITVSNLSASNSSNLLLYSSNATIITTYCSNIHASNIYAGYADITKLKIGDTTQTDNLSACNAYIDVSSNGMMTASNAVIITELYALCNLISSNLTACNITAPTISGSTLCNFQNINSRFINGSNITSCNYQGISSTIWSMYGSNCTLCNTLTAETVSSTNITNQVNIETSTLSVNTSLTMNNAAPITGQSATIKTITASNMSASQVTITSNLLTSNATILSQLTGSNITASNITVPMILCTSNIIASNLTASNIYSQYLYGSNSYSCNLVIDSNITCYAETRSRLMVASNCDFSNVTIPFKLILSNISCSNGFINTYTSCNLTVAALSNTTLSNLASVTTTITNCNLNTSNIIVTNKIQNSAASVLLDMVKAEFTVNSHITSNISTSNITTNLQTVVSNIKIGTTNLANCPLDIYGPFAVYNPSTQNMTEHFYGAYSNSAAYLRAANVPNGIDMGIATTATSFPGSVANSYKSVVNIKPHTVTIAADLLTSGSITSSNSLFITSNMTLSNSDNTKTPNLRVCGIISGDKETHPLQHGLITHYVFDENSTNIIDRSRYCNSALIGGNSYTRAEYAYGRALGIPDTTSTIVIPSPLIPAVATASFWFLSNTVLTGSSVAVLLAGAIDRRIHLGINTATQKLCYQNGDANPIEIDFTIQQNKWYHFCMLMQARSCELYVNGSLAATIPPDFYIDIPIHPIARIGNSGIGSQGGLGLYTDFRLYNRIISENEILKLYNLISPVLKLDQDVSSVKRLVIAEAASNTHDSIRYYGMGYSNNTQIYQVPFEGTHKIAVGSNAGMTLAMASDSNLQLRFTDPADEYRYSGIYCNSNMLGLNIATSNDSFRFTVATESNQSVMPLYISSRGVGVYTSNIVSALEVEGDIHCTGQLIADNAISYWTPGGSNSLVTARTVCVNTTSNNYTLNVDGTIYATSNIFELSDARLKENIVIIPNALAKLSELSGYTYNKIHSVKREAGLLAQEVEHALPEAVFNDGEYKSVAYSSMTALLIEAVKELSDRCDKMQKQISLLM